MDELRFTLRKKDAPSQRRVMRTYGANFKYLRGEPRDVDVVAEGAVVAQSAVVAQDAVVPVEEDASAEAG